MMSMTKGKRSMRNYLKRLLATTTATALVFTIAAFLSVPASASVTASGAKTYTFADVNPTPLTLVANSNAHTINGVSYTATSMQGMNVGTTYIYTVKIETTTEQDGNEVMGCIWRTKIATKEKLNCVFKNEGSSSYLNYSTALGHANDLMVRSYKVGSDTEASNNMFTCTLNSQRGISRLKYVGDNAEGKAQFNFGGYYKMVDSNGNAFAPGSMRYITAKTVNGVAYNYFLCKNDKNFLICRIAYTDLGGPKNNPSVISCYNVFTIDTRNAYFADKDGNGNPGTISQLQSWTNQNFFYIASEGTIYVPLFNHVDRRQSVVLVYDVEDLLTESDLTSQLNAQPDESALVFPSMLNFNTFGDSGTFEIESVGFATGSSEATSPLYFNTNGIAADEGIWYFNNYRPSSQMSYIQKSVLDNSDGTTKIYYTVKYHANGGTQDTSVYIRSYMNDTRHVHGVTAELCKNTFIRSGYTFAGWHLTRRSDGKTLYFVSEQQPDGSYETIAKWYTAGQQPTGATIALYEDCRRVSKLSAVQDDIVDCTAQWN